MLNPPLHTVATEGVWVCESDRSGPVFRALPAPTRAEQAAVAWQTCTKILAALRRRGLWLDMDPADDRFAQDEPALAQYYAASIQGVLLVLDGAGWHTSLEARIPDYIRFCSCLRIRQSFSAQSVSGRW